MKAFICLALLLFSLTTLAQTSPTHGTVSWFELKSKDFHLAEVFYFRVFKWQFKDEAPGFRFILKDGKPIGGFTQLGETEVLGNSGTLLYFNVDNLKKAYSMALASGGRSKQPPTEVPGMGFMAIVIDPDGNEIALFAEKN